MEFGPEPTWWKNLPQAVLSLYMCPSSTKGNILKQNKNYSIIVNYTTKELQEMGYTEDEIITMKSIGIYDEIAIGLEK